ncbi:MAG: extracellular solute-binding protein [Planctomycetes bacterium]|nr:extracellular solute-binding protein [Planctomycetota bacterium]
MTQPRYHWFVAAFAVAVAIGSTFNLIHDWHRRDEQSLVVYCAHDAIFADEVLRDFEQSSGIKVIVKYDSEATKSLGLVNMLIQEKANPQCDVFWNNELLGTCELQAQGVLLPYRGTGYDRIPSRFKDPDGFWTGFAARMRVYIVNTERMPVNLAEIDSRLEKSEDLTRAAIAQPLFGTTLTQYTLQWHLWGAERTKAWHQRLKNGGIREVKGNAATKDLVADGACDFGFTDNDDFFVAKSAGKPVDMVPVRVDGQTVCIPNTVAIINGTSKVQAAQKLVDFLLSAETEFRLAQSDARQIPLGLLDQSQTPFQVRSMADWAADAADLRPLLPARQAVIRWLKSEYMK